jgi:Fungalysin/Thermolysin Propeptide Motif
MRSKSFWALMTVIVVTALALVPSSLSASDSVTAADAAAGDALDSALAYVNSHPADLGVTSADVADLYATSIVKSRHSGVTHVNLNQRFQGLEVFDAHATVNVAAGGRVVFAAGAFVRGLRAAGPAVSSSQSPSTSGSSRRTTERRSSRAAASRMRPSRHGSAGSRPATGCVLPGR